MGWPVMRIRSWEEAQRARPRREQGTTAWCATLLLLASCTGDSLLDVSIRDASATEASALRAELDEMAEAMDIGDVRITSIVVKDSVKGGVAAGSYSPGRRRIALRRSHLGEMRKVLRHEVCHAMDHQLELHADDETLLAEAFDHLGSRVDTYYEDRGEEAQASETFAQLCELGPGPLLALMDPAHQDMPADLLAASRWTLDRAVLRQPSPDVMTFDWVEPGEWPTPRSVNQFGNEHLGLSYEEEAVFFDWRGQVVPSREVTAPNVHTHLGWSDFFDSGDVGPFDGDLVGSGEAASGTNVAVVALPGTVVPHLFVAEPGQMWASRGPAIDPIVRVLDGIVTVAWTDPDDRFHVRRFE